MFLRRILFMLTLLPSLRVQAQNAEVIAYINTWKELAITEMQRTGVPAAITLAQGIHESMAGNSPLAQKSNNHFGIKCKSDWQGEKVYHDDDSRGECFRSYPSPESSFIDHSDFLRNGTRYQFLFQLDPSDYKEWASGLKKAGYATNVRYPQILIKYIEDYNLQQYTLIAMGSMKPEDEILAGNPKPEIRELNTSTASITPVPDPVEEVEPPNNYPAGEFKINHTRVIYAKAGTSLLLLANEHNVSLSRLLEFNELKNEEVLIKSQLVFLQRKRKVGSGDIHVVKQRETIYDVAQAEGIRLESLLSYNFLQPDMQPAAGENLYLKATAPGRPKLVDLNAGSYDMANNTIVSTHIVQDKETLFSIARKYGTTVAKLREWNKLLAGEVRAGQELLIHKN